MGKKEGGRGRKEEGEGGRGRENRLKNYLTASVIHI